ncbi:hypothetical protein [Vibrio mexicanus]|uniref:hypothetical protein n=1 Tax=Vibrio mexicanus TaxID=1004326 RepID=UPI0012F7F510|nr:hypothetical protein [Vibrio mexicanus]
MALLGCFSENKPTFYIGVNHWLGYAPLYLSYLNSPPKNNEYTVIPLESASDVMTSLRNGTLEAGALTLDEVITLANEGIELDIVLVFDISNGADSLLVKPEVGSIHALRGQTVAVEYTAVGALLLTRALEQASMTLSDINLMNCPLNMHVQCYSKASAVVTFEPEKSTILELGALELFNSSQIKGEIIDVLAVRRDVHEKYVSEIQQVIKQYFKGYEDLYVQQDPKWLNQLSDFSSLTQEQLKVAYRGIEAVDIHGNIRLMQGESPKLSDRIAFMKNFLVERGLYLIEMDPLLLSTLIIFKGSNEKSLFSQR